MTKFTRLAPVLLVAVFALGVPAAAEASGFASYFTTPLTGVKDAIRPISGLAALVSGVLFFMSLFKGDGGSMTGRAFTLLIAIAGAIGWATGGAELLFSNLTTSGLGF
jgi:hypothetical protein